MVGRGVVEGEGDGWLAQGRCIITCDEWDRGFDTGGLISCLHCGTDLPAVRPWCPGPDTNTQLRYGDLPAHTFVAKINSMVAVVDENGLRWGGGVAART